MTVPLSYEQQFTHYTAKKYGAMRDRGKGKVNERTGRVLRVASPVEFSLADFRGWAFEKFGTAGACRCHYCGAWLTPATFVPDHDIPLSRGGFNALDNLVICCEPDNDAKGSLTGEAYIFLLKCLEQLPERDRQIVLERLRKSEKLASTVRQFRGRLNQQRSTNPQTEETS